MPVHAIVIPERNRHKHLDVCLAAIRHSAKVCGVEDYEIRVVDGNNPPVELGPNEPMPYWKAHYLNLGIDHTDSRFVTFLDADAVVGPRFMENVMRLEDDTLTKLAYRVRYAPFATNEHEWADRFETYETWPLAYEAYGQADQDRSDNLAQCNGEIRPAFGNSQFSIRRDVLGDLRFDERYIGRGWEDLDMNRSIAERYGDRYRCEMVTDGPHAMFHIKHRHTPGYNASPWNERNRRLFYGEAKTWYACPDLETAEATLAANPQAEAVWPPSDRWLLSRAIPGLDTIIRLEGESEE